MADEENRYESHEHNRQVVLNLAPALLLLALRVQHLHLVRDMVLPQEGLVHSRVVAPQTQLRVSSQHSLLNIFIIYKYHQILSIIRHME